MLDDHLYSVPFQYVHDNVWIRATATTVEVLRNGRRIASHARSRDPHRPSTEREHMPSAHRAHAEWTPSRILGWAEKTGDATRALCAAILASRPHPEQGFRSCLGILRLGKRFGPVRLEAACARANRVNARSYRHVKSILEKGLDRMPLDDGAAATATPVAHENVRGPNYYVN